MVRDVFSNTFTMGRLFRCFSSRNEPCGGADATVGGGRNGDVHRRREWLRMGWFLRKEAASFLATIYGVVAAWLSG